MSTLIASIVSVIGFAFTFAAPSATPEAASCCSPGASCCTPGAACCE